MRSKTKSRPVNAYGNAYDVLGMDGGAEGVRTPDLLNAIQALYQLSYDPSPEQPKVYA
jgi:hypothetical protein